MSRDILWAAGLFEGEGSIAWQRAHKTRRGHYQLGTIVLALYNTDADVVQDFAKAIRVGRVYGPYRKNNGWRKKPMWMWKLTGFRSLAVLKRLRPYLGRRRRAAIAHVSRLWAERSS